MELNDSNRQGDFEGNTVSEEDQNGYDQDDSISENPQGESGNGEPGSNPGSRGTEGTKEEDQDTEAKKARDAFARSILSTGEHPVEKIVREQTESKSADHYYKLGFYTALDPEAVPLETAQRRLRGLLNSQFEKLDHLITEIDQHIHTQTVEIEIELLDFQEKLDEYHERLAGLDSEIEDLEIDKWELEDKIQAGQAELTAIIETVSQERTGLIERRIQALREELSEAALTYREITDARIEISQRDFNKNVGVLKKRAARLQEVYDGVKAKMEVLDRKLRANPGITNHSYRYLYWAGASAAGGAGWFFSSFLGSKEVQSEDFVSFIFSQLFQWGKNVRELNPSTAGMIMVAGLLVILLVTTLLAKLGQSFQVHNLGLGRSRNRTSKDSSGSGLLSPLEKNFYRTKIRAGTFYSLWIRWLPAIFLLGVIFIAFTLGGTNSDNIGGLMTSLSGQVIGTAIAFGMGGLLYLYVRTNIAPRIVAQAEQTPTFSLKQATVINWEVAVTIVFFLLSMAGIGIAPEKLFVIYLGFVGITLLAGMSIAYAIYFRGLNQQEIQLKQELFFLASEIESCEGSPTPTIAEAEDDQFNQYYLSLNQQIFELSLIKSQLATEALAGNSFILERGDQQNHNESAARTALNRIRRFFKYSSKGGHQKITPPSEMTANEIRYHPESGLRYIHKEKELREQQEQLTGLESRIIELKSGHSQVQVEYQSKIQQAEVDVLKLTEARERLARLQIIATQRLEMEKEKREIALRDGFDLGLWQRTNPHNPRPYAGFSISEDPDSTDPESSTLTYQPQ